MYEKIEQCPICKNTQFENHLICEDHTTSHESFAIVKCSKCNFLFTNPRPEKERLSEYYKNNQYISHTDSANNPINLVYKLVRNYTLGKKEALIRQILGKTGTILDYGCGTGDFVRKVSSKNWQAFGYEPDEDARSIATKKNGNNIYSTIDTIKEPVDVITAWHVIEHVPDLQETLKKLKNLLTENGYLILALPNHKSYDATHYKQYWAAYDVPRHLYHFDSGIIQQLATKLKMSIHSVQPMKFDSYYVSLLSEKYKGSNSTITAIRTGMKSNQLAKNSGQYSSLIYVLQK